MENEEIELSHERLFQIVQRIVEPDDPRKRDEPFDSPETFWRAGFHPRAFSWLFRDLEYSTRLRPIPVADNHDSALFFQYRLNGDIAEALGTVNLGKARETLLFSFVESDKWCDFYYIRKAVLCLLFKHSFPQLGPAGKLEYPKWLPGEWARRVTPDGVM